MIKDVNEIIEDSMANGEVSTTHNSIELSEMLYNELFENSYYSYKGDLPNFEFRDLYYVSYSLYIDGELDAVYAQYWWDGLLLSDNLMTGRTSKMYVDGGLLADLGDLDQAVVNDCVFYILTEIHNHL